jgi:hypothetical protein
MKRVACWVLGHKWCGLRWHNEVRCTWYCVRCGQEEAR